MQRRSAARSSGLPDGCFDMWQDYMDLNALLRALCGGLREPDDEDPQWPRRERVAPRSSSQTSSPGRETGSASSLSGSSSSGQTSDYCRLCKQNKESPRVYQSHKLKSDDGKVICPILRSYTCPVCRATGDDAHTRRYCPQARRQPAARGPPVSKSW
ncbi:nanos homolog 2 [Embiotoca jacksoni]|uniref:nanos homolog 2 n=1 Tax=Embiotoca jacksoni TaxID=100190 RepID=UPI00370440FF